MLLPTPRLSLWTVRGSACGNPRYHRASDPACDKATYSASAVDSALRICFFDFQAIVPPPDANTKPALLVPDMLEDSRPMPHTRASQ